MAYRHVTQGHVLSTHLNVTQVYQKKKSLNRSVLIMYSYFSKSNFKYQKLQLQHTL